MATPTPKTLTLTNDQLQTIIAALEGEIEMAKDNVRDAERNDNAEDAENEGDYLEELQDALAAVTS